MTPAVELDERTAAAAGRATSLRTLGIVLAVAAVILGLALRFYRITDNSFVFYDEGMWLLQGHELVEAMPHAGPETRGRLIEAAFHLALRTGKALWAFLCLLRGFFVGAEGYYFPRLLSAVFGSLTIGLVFLFARRLYSSTAVAVLSMALLAVMPTHIFYSRLALQEAFTAFFFLLGMYAYLFARGISVRIFLAGICFAAVFFVNYRMIIIPFFLGCAELYWSLSAGRRPAWGKWLCCTGMFLALVFGIGALDGAANLRVTFGWMFHQSELARGTFALLNLFSYPYYMWTFEGAVFASAFWANGYLLWRRRWPEAFAFVLVLVFMGVFTLPQEKGVRYLTSALPFMAMAVAGVTWRMYADFPRKAIRAALVTAMVILFAGQLWAGFHIAGFTNDYRTAIADMRTRQPGAKFVSTQSMIQKLYVEDTKDVTEFRYHLPYLTYLRAQGVRYLVVGPQAYVSYTPDDLRFQKELKGFLQFIAENVEPEAEYTHFDKRQLRRFVLEHNEHLGRSLAFLGAAEENGYGNLRVYDLNKALTIIQLAVAQWQKR